MFGDRCSKFKDSYSFLSLEIILFLEIDLFLYEDKLRDLSILFFERYSPTFIIFFISLSLFETLTLFNGL